MAGMKCREKTKKRKLGECRSFITTLATRALTLNNHKIRSPVHNLQERGQGHTLPLLPLAIELVPQLNEPLPVPIRGQVSVHERPANE
jgi:hypothetical protein